MPETLSVVREAGRPDATTSLSHAESQPLIVTTLSAVTPSAATRAPHSAWRWLTRLFEAKEEPAAPHALRLSEVISTSETPEKTPPSRLKTGLALAGLAVAGTLGYELARRNGAWQSDNRLAAGNSTLLGLLPAPEAAFLQAQPPLAYQSTPLTMDDALLDESRLYTRLLETTRDEVVARFPGINPQAVEHLLVSPLLHMLTESIQARAHDWAELRQQLTLMVNVMLSTLTIPEHLLLYREMPPTARGRLAGRFTVDNGYAGVSLYGHGVRLWATPAGTPFVTDREGRCSFIRFNQRKGWWEQVSEANNQGYSPQSRQFKERYHVDLADLPAGFSMAYNSTYDYVFVNASVGTTRAVFADGRFLPIRSFDKFAGVAYTNVGRGYNFHRRLLVKTDYGWEFERPSVRMDKPLKYLLESADRGVNNTLESSIGAIGDYDGLSIDKAGQRWLKKDNQYFAVQRAYDAAQRRQQINLTDYAGAVPEYKNGVMILQRADEMLFALSTDTVNNTLVASDPFNIETAAVDYLQKYALLTTAAPTDALPDYHPGLYEGDDFSPMFIAHDQKYAVREYTSEKIRIINQQKPDHRADDIVLWKAGDTLLRIRNGQANIAYRDWLPTNNTASPGDQLHTMVIVHDNKYAAGESAAGKIRLTNAYRREQREDGTEVWSAGNTLLRVRNNRGENVVALVSRTGAREPGAPDTPPPIRIEAALQQQLQQHVDNGGTAKLSPALRKLIKIDAFPLPVAWFDAHSHKSYFLYNDSYFPATITDAADADNPTGQNCINIFASGDFHSQQKLIASLVVENNAGEITVKTRESFLAEKLRVSKAIAGLYCEHQPWREVSGIGDVAHSVSEVLACADFHTAPPAITYFNNANTQDRAAQPGELKARFYPDRVNETQLEILKLYDARQQPNAHSISEALQRVKDEMFPLLHSALYYHSPHWPLIHTYVDGAIGETNEEFRSEIAALWRERLQAMNNWLKLTHVYLVSGKSMQPGARGKSAGQILHMPADGENIYINTHKINPDDGAQVRLITELLPSLASASGTLKDFIPLRQTNGMLLPVHDAREMFIRTCKQDQLTAEQRRYLLAESEKYLKRIPAYRDRLSTLLEPAKLAYLAKYDPAYWAHTCFCSASCVSLLSLDAFYLLAASGKNLTTADAWAKQYARLRASDAPLMLEEKEPQDALPDATPPSAATPAPTAHLLKANKFFVKPADGEKNRGEQFAPDSHDDVFLPWPKPGDPTQQPEQRIFVPGHGNVTIVEIPELKCLGSKEVSFTQVLRWVGEALQGPFKANTLAWQEIYHIDIKGGDCPTDEEVWWMGERATIFDVLTDTVIMFVPQLWPVYALKTIVGPALNMVADDLEGVEVKTEDRVALFVNTVMQIMSFMRSAVPTLKGPERSMSWRKPASKIAARKSPTTAFTRRMLYRHKGEFYLEVAGKDYPLLPAEAETPVIRDEKGHNRLVIFNQQEEHWDFETALDHDVREEGQRNQKKYKMSLDALPEDATMDAGDHDFITLTSNDRADITGVFIGGEFIPARLEKIGEETVAFTTLESISLEEQRIVVQDKYGWRFERQSTKMDRMLAMLININPGAGFISGENSIGAIRSADGLSYDAYGGMFIKKDYKYYRVEKIKEETESVKVKLLDYAGAVANFEHDHLILEGGENIIFPAQTELFNEGDAPFRIESAALQYLHVHAQPSTQILPDRIGPGVFSDPPRRNIGFVAGQDKFTASFYSDRRLRIERKDIYGDGPEIEFWLDKNTWYRVRNEREDTYFDYKDIARCRVARSPGVGSSCPGENIMIEMNLDQRLIQAARDELLSATLPVRTKLTEIRANDIPYLFQDRQTNKYYFKYADKHFNAKIIEATNVVENPTGFPCVKITGPSDFYRSEKEIATIVMYDEGESIKLVDLATFVAEKLKISTEEAVLYNQKSIFNSMPDIDIFEKLTNEAQLTENLYVEQPIEVTAPPPSRLAGTALQDAAKRALFPEHVLTNKNYNIAFFDINTPPEGSSPYVQSAIRFVKRNIDYIQQEMLPGVIKSLNFGHYNHPIVEDYLIEILGKSDSGFLNEVELSLFSRLVSAKDGISNRQIKLMSVLDTTQNKHPLYLRNSKECVYINDSEHIFINIDVLDIGENTKYTEPHEFTSAMINAALRATGTSSHIVDIPKSNGFYINIMDAYRTIQNTARTAAIKPEDMPRMRTVVSRYLQRSPIYHSHLNKLDDMPPDLRKLNYMMRFDPGVRTQVTLNSDNLLTLVTQDLFYLISSTEQDLSTLHPWVKKYGAVRGVLKSGPEFDQSTDLMTLPEIKLNDLSPTEPGKSIVGEVKGNKQIYSTTTNNLLLKQYDKYYPVEFIGQSGRIIAVGQQDEIRQVYYYLPDNGIILPIQPLYTRNNALNYYPEMDLFASRAPGSDYEEIFRYDLQQRKLVSTGANRLTRLPGDVTRVEFPWFNLYHPRKAPQDIYLQGFGKALTTRSTVPNNINLVFYTQKGGQLVPYSGSANDLLNGKFTPQELVTAGGESEDYIIRPFNGVSLNHYHLARRYQRNMIQLISRATTLTDLTEAMAALFPNENINLHLYMCRIPEGKRLLPAVPEKAPRILDSEGNLLVSETLSARWAFDQQVAGGAVQPERSLKGFLPIRESHVFLRYGTIENMAKKCIERYINHLPYDVYYGLDINTYASKNIPPYIKDVRIQAKRNIDKAKATLDTAWIKLNEKIYQTPIKNYLSTAFDSHDEEVLREVIKRLKTHIIRIKNFLRESEQLDYTNIGVVSTRQTPDPDRPGAFISPLAGTEQVYEIPSAFMVPGDAFRRIFIMGDSYPQMTTNPGLHDYKEKMLEHVLLHEASHIASDTFDVIYIKANKKDFSGGTFNLRDPQRGLKQLNAKLDSGKLKNSAIWADFVPLVNRYLAIQGEQTEQEVIKMINDSPMLKSNLMMENADSVAMLVKHISRLGLDGRFKREAETEQVDDDTEYKHLGLLFAATREHHIKDLL